MRVSQQLHQYQPSLNRRGAVIDFDTIIAYILFTSTIIMLVNFSLGLTAPFATSIELLNKEKSTITVRDMVDTTFLSTELSSLCDINYLNMRLLSVTYEIKSFAMPVTDSLNFSANSINGSVVFYRNGEELRVITGSVNEHKSINVNVIVSGSPSVSNLTLESNDSYSISADAFNNFIITLKSNVSNGDIDELIIKPVTGLVGFEITGVDLSNCFIGNLTLSNYCGDKGIQGKRTSFNRYGVMTDGRTDYGVKLTGDIWWTS
ncbi:MAG: hypothetical protein WC307_00360 [Candidatus Nanoarchaeia archaeon]|jgi:hypothetical protein